ncbi:hypothetical protein [Uliginosibacterium gangwonense]|uniref:hypothetical protein n=1 Tax=Uliginosibacterium gangwonense TaxID=392736 RepID=UPI00037F84DD|nr:hypothetical protein [Uliginosibacterium gangwonense]
MATARDSDVLTRLSREHSKARREEIKLAASRRRRQAIADYCAAQWDYSVRDISPKQLSARAAFSLLCIVRNGGWITPTTVGALDDGHPRIAPYTLEFQTGFPLLITTHQLAVPSPDSPLKAFPDDTKGQLSWSLGNVHWQLLMRNPVVFIQELETLVASRAWPLGWAEEVSELWIELAIAECLEFADITAVRKGLPIPCVWDMAPLLKTLLAEYSVSQVFALLWAAIEDTAAFVEHNYISMKRADDFLVGACRRRADWVYAEGLTVSGLQRDAILSRTQASYVLHDLFLNHGEDGFFKRPTPV